MRLLAHARERYEGMTRPLLLPLALVIFTASGFSGLIYESIWSHYLKLFLGHAAYAQTLVLAIFMGGMAVGAWGASRVSARWRDLLLVYAVIEALIGAASLAFHPTFVAATAFAHDQVIPALGTPLAINAFKWTLAAALILPQSVLLGMTFPLMTGGLLRLRPRNSGYAIAMLYFTNSLGAGVGVLASGFYLIGSVGLPGSLAAAAVVNLAVAAAVMFLPRTASRESAAPAPTAAPAQRAPQLAPLLWVAALTGVSSFMYEMGWIRMLSLVLGSSTHAFELMLSAFILGIAFGGLWVRRRIDSAKDTVRLLAFVQILMGIAALATLPVYGSTFQVMQATLGTLASTESGYVAFNVVSHALCLAVMFPAAFCAGMTLPLITASLLRQGAGERAIGQVYAANTAGAIAGVLLSVHIGFPLLGLKGLIVAGAVIDLALGVWLLAKLDRARASQLVASAAGLSVIVVGVAVFGMRLDAHLMASGVYRHAHLLREDSVRLHIDGKTATVSLTGNDEVLTLRTNGKADGAVRMDGGPPVIDEITMTFLGALPHFLAPDARRVANIGFGTGLTTHVLLASPTIETVDTIEIEPAIVRAAEYFRPVNRRAFEDPRSRIHYEDAKTYFAAQQIAYDVILSEPSNPWVSGVASLFSTEFYRDVRRYLRDGGLFMQWVQLYEMTPALLATIVVALNANFSDYEFWLSNDGDMLIVAVHNGRVPRPDASAFRHAGLREELDRFRIRNLDDLYLHRLGGREVLAPYFGTFGVEANSDFFPTLELKAPMARFMRANAGEVVGLLESSLALVSLFETGASRLPDPRALTPGNRPWWQRAAWAQQALAVREYMRTGNAEFLAALTPELAADMILVRAALVECKVRLPAGAARTQFGVLAHYVSSHLPRQAALEFWDHLGRARCDGMAPEDRVWFRMHRAIAAGNASEIALAAESILEAQPGLSGSPLAQALSAYMAGRILMKDAPAALRAHLKHRPAIAGAVEWGPIFRFLLGQADALGGAEQRQSIDRNGQPGSGQRASGDAKRAIFNGNLPGTAVAYKGRAAL
jgi:predicted membrane-bound spermidine synthase